MGRAPCCDKTKVKRGPWSPEEDATLKNYVEKYGTGGNWIALPQKAGLMRCGKSCRLRWLNYLRPDIKHGRFTVEEDNIILTLYSHIGSRWSVIASHLQGRTDNDVKNYWNTKLKKKIMASETTSFSATSKTANIPNNSMRAVSAAAMADYNETIYYENQTFSMEASNAQASVYVNNQQNIVPEMAISDPSQFHLSKLIDVQENRKNSSCGFSTATVPSPQEVSSISPYSFSVNSCPGSTGGSCSRAPLCLCTRDLISVSWTGNASAQDGFLMDFAPETSLDFVNCVDSTFFDISHTEPSGGFHHH